jgi:phage portal protein BeeE
MKIFGWEIRKSSGLANPDQWLVDALTGGSTYAGVPVTEQTALRMSAVYACVRVLSESVAMLPFILYRRDG